MSFEIRDRRERQRNEDERKKETDVECGDSWFEPMEYYYDSFFATSPWGHHIITHTVPENEGIQILRGCSQSTHQGASTSISHLAMWPTSRYDQNPSRPPLPHKVHLSPSQFPPERSVNIINQLILPWMLLLPSPAHYRFPGFRNAFLSCFLFLDSQPHGPANG